MIALTAATLLTPLERIEQALLLLEDGVIREVRSRAAYEIPGDCRVIDFGDGIFAPGLIDIHIHGAAGRDVMNGDPDSLAAIERFLAKHAVTSYLPTTITAPVDSTLAALESLANAIDGRDVCAVLGSVTWSYSRHDHCSRTAWCAGSDY